jgi:hypothetical protein
MIFIPLHLEEGYLSFLLLLAITIWCDTLENLPQKAVHREPKINTSWHGQFMASKSYVI